jgi:hypothetical protein
MTAYSDRTRLELRKFGDALSALIEAAGEIEDRKGRDSLLLRYVFTSAALVRQRALPELTRLYASLTSA